MIMLVGVDDMVCSTYLPRLALPCFASWQRSIELVLTFRRLLDSMVSRLSYSSFLSSWYVPADDLPAY